jgi:soluble lytic murein transglycosylase-like protein
LGVQLAALALTESACVADAEAPNGARGLLQLMPATARAYGLVVNGAVDERLDVDASTRAAARYLSDLHHTFGSWEVALVGYTDGPVMVAKRLAGVGAEKPFNDAAWSGAYSEYSVRYVARVRAYELILKNGKQLEALDDVPAEDVAAP